MRAILEHGLTDSRQVYRHIKKNTHFKFIFIFNESDRVPKRKKERKKERKNISTP